MAQSKNLVIAGVAAFAAFMAYLYVTSAPETAAVSDRPLATAPATVERPEPQAPTPEAPASSGESVMPDPEDVDFATALDDGGYFDDSSYPETDDDLLIIEQGDASRYVTAADRAAEQARQQRAKAASLNASTYVGDDRVRAISTLGNYAGEGNADAVAELRAMLQSPDGELRADALEALAELLPGTNVVPAYAAEPPSDSEIERIIEALQSQEP